MQTFKHLSLLALTGTMAIACGGGNGPIPEELVAQIKAVRIEGKLVNEQGQAIDGAYVDFNATLVGSGYFTRPLKLTAGPSYLNYIAKDYFPCDGRIVETVNGFDCQYGGWGVDSYKDIPINGAIVQKNMQTLSFGEFAFQRDVVDGYYSSDFFGPKYEASRATFQAIDYLVLEAKALATPAVCEKVCADNACLDKCASLKVLTVEKIISSEAGDRDKIALEGNVLKLDVTFTLGSVR